VTPRPLIGVTGPDRGGTAAWLLTSQAIRRAGGAAVRITPARPAHDALDGLVLGGGADVDPALYHETATSLGEVVEASGAAADAGVTPGSSRFLAPAILLLRKAFARDARRLDVERDTLERSVLDEALSRDLPVLAICRGAQLFNVHCGGTLFTDLRAFYEEVPQVRSVLPKKSIDIAPESHLASVLGATRCRVNAIHSQAIRSVGRGLSIVAREPTGVVQAVEQPDHRFRIGVQWHPELLPQHKRQRSLFEALVRAA
jgi:putative glutamine amidotransferase